MSLLQIQVDQKLKKAMQAKAKMYGVPMSSLVRICLVKSFLPPENGEDEVGNIFNADRDNNGKGIPIDDFIALL